MEKEKHVPRCRGMRTSFSEVEKELEVHGAEEREDGGE